MKRFIIAFLVGTALIASTAVRPAMGRVHVGVSIGIPPPPTIVFNTEPEVTLIPNTSVYYAPAATEYDMYRYGSYWYVNRNGYWYRARRYSGPFTVVTYTHVPRQIVSVPATYRHHPLRPHVRHFRHHRHHRRHLRYG